LHHENSAEGTGGNKKSNPFDLMSASFCHRGVRGSVGTHLRVLDAGAKILWDFPNSTNGWK